MTPRLLLPAPVAAGELRALDDDQQHYLSRVLRLRDGDPLQVFDGRGSRFAAQLQAAGERHCQVRIGQPLPATPESPLAITLVQGISAADKMDWTIEKAVELGVAAVLPLACERSQVKLSPERAQRRLEHWQRLIRAACMQSGRDWLAQLLPVGRLVAEAPLAGLPAPAAARRLVLSPPGGALAAPPLSVWAAMLPAPPPAVVLLAGPESGLSQREVELAIAQGFEPVSLGPRTLRTETAGLAAIAALQVKFGDF